MLNKNVLTDIVDSLKCNYISEDLTVMESAVAEALKKYWSLTEKGDIEDVMDALADNGIEVKYGKEDSSPGGTSLTEYLNSIGRIPLLTREEEAEIGTKAYAGDKEAQTRLVLGNLRLVVCIAKRYAYKDGRTDFDDLIQYGNIGLIRASRMYDPEQGVKFSTYAAFWIKHDIIRGMAETTPITLPAYLFEKGKKMKEFFAEFDERNGRKPTTAEVAVKFGVGEETMRCYSAAQEVGSLEKQLFEGDETSEMQSYLRSSEPTPEEKAIRDSSREYLMACMSKVLKKKELEVILYRYGFKEVSIAVCPKDIVFRKVTLEMVGREMGFTRERIRQLEESALEKLRNHKELINLIIEEMNDL